MCSPSHTIVFRRSRVDSFPYDTKHLVCKKARCFNNLSSFSHAHWRALQSLLNMSSQQAQIPTIDLQPYIDGSNPDDGVSKVRAACETYGFMQVIGHDIPLDVQERAFACAKTFFALPTEQKLALTKDSITGRGYEPLRSQGLQSSDLPDEKEVSTSLGRPCSACQY